MTGASASLGRGGILVAVVALGMALPAPSRGANVSLTQVLPGSSPAALVADLDGDGVRELVRITVDSGSAEARVEAWEHDGGLWVTVGSASLRRDSDQEAYQPVDPGVDPGALLVWRLEGRERVIALTAGADPESEIGSTCCLTIAEVVREGSGIELRRLPHDGGAPLFVQVLDVDDDGTDELALFGSADGDGQVTTIELLRWNGTAFASSEEPVIASVGFAAWAGDSDGLAGDELIVGPSETAQLQRYSWVGGVRRVEETSLDLEDPFGIWIAGIADGALVMALPEEARVVRWPSGEQPRTVASATGFEFPSITVVGSGEDALVITQEGFRLPGSSAPSASVHDLELRTLGVAEVSDAAAHLWRLVERGMQGSEFPSRLLYPYTGPLPGLTFDGREAHLAAGQLIQPDGAGGFASRPIAPLPGVGPVGLLGPDDAWIALSNGYPGAASVAYLYSGVIGPDIGRVSLVPLADVMDPDGGDPAGLQLRNAIADGAGGYGPIALRAHGDGFQAVVTAPAGSWVVVTVGSVVDELTVGTEPLVVDIAPPSRRDGDENLGFEASLIVATPGGHALTREWEGTFVREPPDISAIGSTDLLSLSATITGSASPGGMVSVDGRVVDTGPDGSFETSIDAPIWPSRVHVVVSDGLGNEASQELEVVGLFDYRGLPWVALVVLVTLAAGVVLFVHTPQRRRAAAVSRLEEGRLQELDLEELEELERAELGGR